jgi:hypothetical protein
MDIGLDDLAIPFVIAVAIPTTVRTTLMLRLQ